MAPGIPTEERMMTCKISTRKIHASIGSNVLNGISAVLLLVLLYWRVFESMEEPGVLASLALLTSN
jgi:hypothetical protein